MKKLFLTLLFGCAMCYGTANAQTMLYLDFSDDDSWLYNSSVFFNNSPYSFTLTAGEQYIYECQVPAGAELNKFFFNGTDAFPSPSPLYLDANFNCLKITSIYYDYGTYTRKFTYSWTNYGSSSNQPSVVLTATPTTVGKNGTVTLSASANNFTGTPTIEYFVKMPNEQDFDITPIGTGDFMNYNDFTLCGNYQFKAEATYDTETAEDIKQVTVSGLGVGSVIYFKPNGAWWENDNAIFRAQFGNNNYEYIYFDLIEGIPEDNPATAVYSLTITSAAAAVANNGFLINRIVNGTHYNSTLNLASEDWCNNNMYIHNSSSNSGTMDTYITTPKVTLMLPANGTVGVPFNYSANAEHFDNAVDYAFYVKLPNQPAFSQITDANNPDTYTPPSLAGTYTFKVVATDGIDTAEDIKTITVSKPQSDNITVMVKQFQDWGNGNYNLYTFSPNPWNGTFSGGSFTITPENICGENWYSYSFPNTIQSINIIFRKYNDWTGNSEQTTDIPKNGTITKSTCYILGGYYNGKIDYEETCPEPSVALNVSLLRETENEITLNATPCPYFFDNINTDTIYYVKYQGEQEYTQIEGNSFTPTLTGTYSVYVYVQDMVKGNSAFAEQTINVANTNNTRRVTAITKNLGVAYLGDYGAETSLEDGFKFKMNDDYINITNDSNVQVGYYSPATAEWDWSANVGGNYQTLSADFGTLQFTETGNWYFVGRGRYNNTKEYIYAYDYPENNGYPDNIGWGNSTSEEFDSCQLLTVLPLLPPENCVLEVSETQDEINLSSDEWLDHKILIVFYAGTKSEVQNIAVPPQTGTTYGHLTKGDNIWDNEGEGVFLYFDYGNQGDTYSDTLNGDDGIEFNNGQYYTFYFYTENNGYYSEPVIIQVKASQSGVYTGTEQPQTAEKYPVIYSENGKIYVVGATDFKVYNILGKELPNHNLHQGIYIVKLGNKTYKMIVQ